MHKYLLIVGGGKFGEIAVHFALKNDYRTILIDEDENCCARKLIREDCNSIDECVSSLKALGSNSIIFLNKSIDIVKELLNNLSFEYIIPVVPTHLLAFLFTSELKLNSIQVKPQQDLSQDFLGRINKDLVQSYNINQGIVCLSYAQENEICPNNCAGPIDYCPNFKRKKPVTITNYLKEILEIKDFINIAQNNRNRISVVLNSIQLIPGLGGLKGIEVYDVLSTLKREMKNLKIKDYDIIVATSCNCHGVINFLKNY